MVTSPSSVSCPSLGPEKPPRPGRFIGANLRNASTSQLPSGTTEVQTTQPSTSVVVTIPHGSTSSSPITPSTPITRRFTPVPHSLLTDPALQSDMSALPANYSFELPKTIHRLRQADARRVALQLPEGLLLYATTISDIITCHTSATSTVILADVTYGACCVDDLSAASLGCDFLVHYGHSCLVPISTTRLPTLYIFVHIAFDPSHLVATLRHNLPADTRVALVGTIQFVDTLHSVCDELLTHFPHLAIPQKRPLSPGELLGCTAPIIKDADTVVYVGDGRFHLESAMIANPQLKFLRYDPYAKRLTHERYATEDMHIARRKAIAVARHARAFGVVLGTLGRQGSPKILRRLTDTLREAGKSYFVVLLSELTAAKLQRLEGRGDADGGGGGGVEAWVQIACPRLSIDWGERFSQRPLLTPYECLVAMGKVKWRDVYPMDFYAKDGGEWTNYYKPGGDVAKSSKRLAARRRQQATETTEPQTSTITEVTT